MKVLEFVLIALFAFNLGGCGGGGDGGEAGNITSPPKSAEVVVSNAAWITHGSFYYKCPDTGPCKLTFPVTVTLTAAGAHTDVEVYRIGSPDPFRKDTFTSAGSEHTFQMGPIEVSANEAINVRLVSSANARIVIPSFQSLTGGQLVTTQVTKVPYAEVIDDDLTKGEAKFQFKCPAGTDSCKLASFMLALSNATPGAATYVRVYTLGASTPLEEQSFTTAGTTSSQKITSNVVVPAGATVEYRIASGSNTNISLSYRIAFIGEKMLRPLFRTDPTI